MSGRMLDCMNLKQEECQNGDDMNLRRKALDRISAGIEEVALSHWGLWICLKRRKR